VKLRDFDIGILHLKNGVHHFVFEVDEAFFEEHFAYRPFERGNFQAEVVLEKTERLLEFRFDIQGDMVLVCDRSLEEFSEPIRRQEVLHFRYGMGEEIKELSEELYEIPQHLQSLNLAQFIFEFIALAVPMKKLHPRFRDEEDMDETGIMVYQSESEEESEDTPADDQPADPRFAALRKLKKD